MLYVSFLLVVMAISAIYLLLVSRSDSPYTLEFLAVAGLILFGFLALVLFLDNNDGDDVRVLDRYPTVQFHSGSVDEMFIARVSGELQECEFTRSGIHLVCDGEIVRDSGG